MRTAADDESIEESERRLPLVAVVPLVLLLVTALGRAVAKAAAPLGDPDTPWHLVMGHRFLHGLSLRHPGAMSPFGTEDWRPRDWAVQCGMALFDDWFGLPGVAWLFGMGVAALAVVQLRTCLRHAGFGAAVLATALGILVGYNGYSARPQLVSFVLVAVTIGAILRSEVDLKVRWWLAPVTGLWACVHGMWFLGPVIQGVLLCGLLLDRRMTRGLATRLGLLLMASLAAVAVTPNGLYLLAHPLGQTQTGTGYILEYIAPSRTSPSFVMWSLLFVLVVITWLRTSRPSWVRIGILGLAAMLALLYLRTIVLGTVLITPLVADAFNQWSPLLRQHVSKQVERFLSLGGAVLIGVVLALVVPGTAKGVDQSLFPTSWDAQLDRLPPTAVVFNELSDGGYLVWRHPGLRIVGDGNSDQYSGDWLTSWFSALNAGPGWQQFLARTGADYALLTDDSPLREELVEQGWTVVDAHQERVLLSQP